MNPATAAAISVSLSAGKTAAQIIAAAAKRALEAYKGARP
jgi:hypothetical protein